MNDVTLTGDQFILFALLLKLGVMAGLATVLISSARFKRLLFAEREGPGRDMKLGVLLASLFSFVAAVRILVGYGAVDVSLPGAFLIGLMCGIGPGAAAGVIISAPAVLGGEYLALPLFAAAGITGGVIRRSVADYSIIWSFSPLPFVNMCVGIPLKIWNNTRLEQQLEQRELRLVEARYQALKSQINPHFLFNTLNSVASCIGSEPRKARWIIVKLSEILRRLLYSEGDFVPLSKELDFIESYLQIETIRFGEEKLRVTTSIDPRVLDVPVPGMVLQPFVENALKHGIAPLIEGGRLDLSAGKEEGATVVTIRDNGPGMREDYSRKGIGVRNVVERL
ncbi:MAG: histidine kinase, partial [Chitinivibrionia bacterium]|nr:histidine kinase [Chitinivibrionia bacterium]